MAGLPEASYFLEDSGQVLGLRSAVPHFGQFMYFFSDTKMAARCGWLVAEASWGWQLPLIIFGLPH